MEYIIRLSETQRDVINVFFYKKVGQLWILAKQKAKEDIVDNFRLLIFRVSWESIKHE